MDFHHFDTYSGESVSGIDNAASVLNRAVESAGAVLETGASTGSVGSAGGQALVEGLTSTLGQNGEVDGNTTVVDVNLNEEEDTVDGKERGGDAGGDRAGSARDSAGSTRGTASGTSGGVADSRNSSRASGATSSTSGGVVGTRDRNTGSSSGRRSRSNRGSAVEDIRGGGRGSTVLDKSEVGAGGGSARG